MTSVAIVEDERVRAQDMIEKMSERGVRAQFVDSWQDLLELLTRGNIDLCSIDIDLGDLKEKEGLIILEHVQAWEREHDAWVFKAVVTSHPEFEGEATTRGADTFIVKSSAKSDALMLIAELHSIKADRESQRGTDAKTELLRREAEELARCARRLRRKWTPEIWRESARTIERCLDIPFMDRQELALLVGLDELVNRYDGDDEEPVTDLILTAIRTGAEALAKGVTDSSYSEWYTKNLNKGVDSIRGWYREGK